MAKIGCNLLETSQINEQALMVDNFCNQLYQFCNDIHGRNHTNYKITVNTQKILEELKKMLGNALIGSDVPKLHERDNPASIFYQLFVLVRYSLSFFKPNHYSIHGLVARINECPAPSKQQKTLTPFTVSFGGIEYVFESLNYLAERSGYFLGIHDLNSKEKHANKIDLKVENYTPIHVEICLKYLQGYWIDQEDDFLNQHVEELMSLIHLTCFFNIPRLNLLCQLVLIKKIQNEELEFNDLLPESPKDKEAERLFLEKECPYLFYMTST